jgi:hypothetical protein
MVKFPKLCRRWVGRDLADHGPNLWLFRPESYEGHRPELLAAGVHAWQDDLDTGDAFADPEDGVALEMAGEVKTVLGGNYYYVEFRPFRGGDIRGGGAVELEVPAFITDPTR